MVEDFEFKNTPWKDEFSNAYQDGKIFIQDNLSLELPIYRYTTLENLLHILSRSEYNISKRTFFTDGNEQGLYCDHKYTFDLCPVGGDLNYCEAYQKHIAKQNNEVRQMYISCWTENENESFLMWKSYASNGIGVRIETNIAQLLNSLHSNSSKIFCSRVNYHPEGYKDTWFKKVFVKKPEYEQEQEVRICVCPNRNNRIYCDRLMLKVNTPFITSVTLSPFLSVLEQKFLLESLNKSYPNLVIKRSLLVEKC